MSTADTTPDTVSPTDLECRRADKRQEQGRTIGALFYMLVRCAATHSVENPVFVKPIKALVEVINYVFAVERRFEVRAAESCFLVNDEVVDFGVSGLENLRYVTQEFQSKGVGGFWLSCPATTQDVARFVRTFSREGERTRALSSDKPGVHLRTTQYLSAKELLEKVQEGRRFATEKVERRRHLMVVYARGVIFVQRYFNTAASGDFSVPISRGARVVQDFVDLYREQREHFLGVTTSRSESDYVAYHSVNCCLLSIVLGSELGLSRSQLHELGMAALLSQIGLSAVPERVLGQPARLSAGERAHIDHYPIRAVKRVLRARGLDPTTMRRIVAGYESKVDYAVPRRRSDGDMELVVPSMGLGVYGRVLAIVDCYDSLTSKRPFREAYGSEQAIALMFSQLRYRFDPILLRIFMRVMAIPPIRVDRDRVPDAAD